MFQQLFDIINDGYTEYFAFGEQCSQFSWCSNCDHEAVGSNHPSVRCCVIKQDALFSLLSTGLTEGKPTI